MKKLLAVFLSIAMLFVTSFSASADNDFDAPIDTEIAEGYQYTSEIYNTLSISSKTATCYSFVKGDPNKVTKIEIKQTLYEQIGVYWYYVTSWNKTVDSWYGKYTTTKSSLKSGTTYRLITEAKVYSGSDYETVTFYGKYVTC